MRALSRTWAAPIRMPTLKGVLLAGASHRALRHGGVKRIAMHPRPEQATHFVTEIGFGRLT